MLHNLELVEGQEQDLLNAETSSEPCLLVLCLTTSPSRRHRVWNVHDGTDEVGGANPSACQLLLMLSTLRRCSILLRG